MRRLRAYFVRLGELFHRKRRDQELAAELESHLQLHIADNLRAGMTPVEARRQALIRFGGMESTVETYRERRGFSFGATVLQDLRYALRQLRKSPGFTAAVVLSLALGIGANTAIFSLIDAVMLKVLPVKNPEELVLLNWVSPSWPDLIIHQLSGNFDSDRTGRSTSTSFSYPTFQELRAKNTTLASTFAFADTGKMNLSADGEAGLAEGELASGDYFSGLGVRPAIGRLFADFDDKPDSQPTAVISYRYWERRFGRNPSVVGKAIAINGIPFTIIGVTSPEFFGLQPGTALDLWMPLRMQPQVKPMWTRGLSKFLQRDDWWLMIMGRLQPAVSEQSALAQLGVIFRQSATDPGDSGIKSQGSGPSKTASSQSESLTLESTPAGKGLGDLRNEFSKPLFILMTVVGLVLLIACANVANLLLARATSRHKEIAVRLAVGAARRRLIRQLLTESVLLAAIGGAFGLLLAYCATHLLITLMSSGRKLIDLSVRPDLHILAFTTAVSIVTGVLFGLVPAVRGTRLDLTAALKEDSKGSAARKRNARIGLGKVLVVSQVVMSFLLLAGAGLFVRTLVNLENINVGFDGQNILLFGIDPTQKGYKGQRIVDLYQELGRRIEALPGVRSATFSMLGQIGVGGWTENISIQGYVPQPGESGNSSVGVSMNGVGPRFLDTMSIPLLLGRSINESDKSNAPKVAVISETFARKYLGGSNPIGRRFGLGKKPTSYIEIVGVAADTKYGDLRRESPPMAYIPCFQIPELDLVPVTFEIRTIGNPTSLIPGVRLVVQSLDKDLPLSDVKTQVEQIDQTLFQERLFAKLSSFFGLLALILACIGIYGIMSYAVARRTNEIGIRMALGARQEDILSKVLREAFVLVLAGVAIGIPIALATLRLIASMLFGLRPTDPLTLAGAIAFMLAVAAIAGYLPARRASRVDPMVALRYE